MFFTQPVSRVSLNIILFFKPIESRTRHRLPTSRNARWFPTSRNAWRLPTSRNARWLPTLRHNSCLLLHLAFAICTEETTLKCPRSINSTLNKLVNADITTGNSMYASENSPERPWKCQQHTTRSLTSFHSNQTAAVGVCCLHCPLYMVTKNKKWKECVIRLRRKRDRKKEKERKKKIKIECYVSAGIVKPEMKM